MVDAIVIRACLFDIDGSLTPQAGPIDPRIGALLGEIQKRFNIPLGPSTGKSADVAMMLGRGIGLLWDHISGENGAQFYHLEASHPVPIWKPHDISIDRAHLSLFAGIIQLDPLSRTFLCRGKEETPYRPEPKENTITMFPPGSNLEITKFWLAYFEEVVATHNLDLVMKRHSDGAIDIIPKGVSKQIGIQEVCKMVECEPISILTVVDGSNDDELAAGTTAIAVGNAVPKIKEIVSKQGGFIANLPDGLGFAEGLLHYARKGYLPKGMIDTVLRIIPEVEASISR